jgi:hypothetical protein
MRKLYKVRILVGIEFELHRASLGIDRSLSEGPSPGLSLVPLTESDGYARAACGRSSYFS